MTRGRWFTGLVLVGLLPLTAPGFSAGATPAPTPAEQTGIGPTSTAAPVPALPVSVRLGSLTPVAPQPGDTLILRGTLHNDSPDPVTNLDVSLRYRDSRVGSRSEFDDYATTSDGPLPGTRAGDAVVSVGRSSIDPGATVAFRIKVPVDSLNLDQRSWQVYEIGVQVVGVTPTAGTETVGRLRTFLPWAPLGVPGVGLPTQVAWVWPLADRPHRLVGSTWLDDDLAAALTPDGRLGRLLAEGLAAEQQKSPPGRARTAVERQRHIVAKKRPAVTPVPVTWAVDPMLVQDVQAMTSGYKVTTGRSTETGRGTPYAKAWLSSLRTAVNRGGGEVLALPYADPDIVAATRAGLATEVQLAINKGQASLAAALDTGTLTYAWPPNGQVDEKTLESLFTAGVRTLVLDGAALPILGGEPAETPGAHAQVVSREGNLDALLVDDGLRAVIGVGMSNPALQPLALQRFLAELLMIQAELPSDQRALVVAPDRRWAPDPAFAAALLADTGKVPWVQPVPLSTALDNPISSKVTRAPLNYPRAARAVELTPNYLAAVRAAKARADAFANILTVPGDGQSRDFDDAVLRTLSSAWRTDPVEGMTRLTAVRAALASTMRRVRIATGTNSFVTLTSNSGTVPVTVSNELDVPVHVVVGITSGLHLKVAGNGRTSEVIPPHRRIPIDVKATAQTSGVFPLEVTLYTPSGQTYQKVKLFVRSTAYGVVALLITGGATGVLMVAVVVRLIRRGLRARRRLA
ncbi:MAG: hypothetical protein JO079_01275 [Frankiaceae bacterium]|nr:hypothetical protein [Frankiaceae bacterium]MBV9369723.1 hypothetical protein [Frankiales bacterium]